MTKFVSIVSGKGGVGKTATSINLGAALSSFGKETLVADCNIPTPNVGLYLGSSRFKFTLHDALRGKSTLRDAVHIHSSGLKFIPGNVGLEECQKANVNNIEKVMLDLYGTTDLVLLDSAPGIGVEAKSAINASDEVIVVTNPDVASVTDALKIAKVVRENGKNVYGVVVNRVKEKNDISADNVAVILSTQLLGIIPEDSAVQDSFSKKHPSVFAFPEARSSIAYKKLAAELLGQEYEETVQKPGFLSRLFRKKQ